LNKYISIYLYIEANRRDPCSVLRLFKKYRRSDLVVTQYAGKKGGKFSLLSKIMARFLSKSGGFVGFEDVSAWNRVLFDVKLDVNPNMAVVWHEREGLRAVGAPISIGRPTLSFTKDKSVLSRFSLIPGQYIVVHLFAGGAGRGLHPDKKKELIAKLAAKNPDLKLVISGGKDDKEEAVRVSEGISALVVAGLTSLQELINLISESRCVISVDTGVAHITAHLGKKLSVIRTCLAPNWWFADQYGADARIAVHSHDASCADGHIFEDYPTCINSVDLEDVVISMLQ
jgi:ADP-heptose:LPS heptosyltransferase